MKVDTSLQQRPTFNAT